MKNSSVNELLVVEGAHDRARLEKMFDCDIICTGGLSLSEDTLVLIEKTAQSRKVIVLTDPDRPGEAIRNRIRERVPEAVHVFVERNKAIGKRNVGIEYVSEEDLREALKNEISFGNKKMTLSWEDYMSLGLMGNGEKREKLCNKLHLSFSNNKTLYRRLNMMGMDIEKIRELINEQTD